MTQHDGILTSVDIPITGSLLHYYLPQLLLVIILLVMTVIYFNVSRRGRTSNLSTTFVSDEDLFKHPPQLEDCPICSLRLPSLETGSKHYGCCGKIVCSGCIHAVAMSSRDVTKCPFCRTALASADEEELELERTMERIKANDAVAIYNLGCDHSEGEYGLQRDRNKALDLWHRSGELGYAGAFFNIGNAYYYGRGVARDEKKGIHYYKLAAMGGDSRARQNLGMYESLQGNNKRAIKHFMIAVEFGSNGSLKNIKQMYSFGHATKDDYTKAFKAYQTYLLEIKSDQRDKAAAFSDQYRYYE